MTGGPHYQMLRFYSKSNGGLLQELGKPKPAVNETKCKFKVPNHVIYDVQLQLHGSLGPPSDLTMY